TKDTAPVVRVKGVDPAIPDVPKVPTTDAKKDDPVKKTDAPVIPEIPALPADKKSDAPIIPPPPPDTKSDVPIIPPPPPTSGVDNVIPTVTAPTIGGKKDDVGAPVIGPMPMDVGTPKPPTKGTDSPSIPTIDPVPTITIPSTGSKVEAPPTVPPAKRNTY